jgi:hypothetical protein
MIETERTRIDKVVEEVKTVSLSERQSDKSEEELINDFLDAINKLKKNLINYLLYLLY